MGFLRKIKKKNYKKITKKKKAFKEGKPPSEGLCTPPSPLIVFGGFNLLELPGPCT